MLVSETEAMLSLYPLASHYPLYGVPVAMLCLTVYLNSFCTLDNLNSEFEHHLDFFSEECIGGDV